MHDYLKADAEVNYSVNLPKTTTQMDQQPKIQEQAIPEAISQ